MKSCLQAVWRQLAHPWPLAAARLPAVRRPPARSCRSPSVEIRQVHFGPFWVPSFVCVCACACVCVRPCSQDAHGLVRPSAVSAQAWVHIHPQNIISFLRLLGLAHMGGRGFPQLGVAPASLGIGMCSVFPDSGVAQSLAAPRDCYCFLCATQDRILPDQEM